MKRGRKPSRTKDIIKVRKGLIIYATQYERHLIHCAAARLMTDGKRMSASQFALEAALKKAHSDEPILGEVMQEDSKNPGANLQVYCQEKDRHVVHRAAKQRQISGSDFVLLSALERAKSINARPVTT